MKTLRSVCILLLTILLFTPELSFSIPAFARKYGFNCNMCHTAYTKLNDFGQRYRDNGYQIPGQTGGEKTVFDTSPPLALRTTAGLTLYNKKEGTTAGFNLYGLDLLAAGVFHKNISFLLIYIPSILEPSGAYSVGTLESASIIFSNIIEDALSVRIGRFEPAYHPFSSKRKYNIFAPYEVYTFATPSNSFVFDDNQIGIEATGHFRNGFKYGLGVVNGTGARPDNNVAKDVYVNLLQTFGKGDGQSAGQRIGAFGYYGWQSTLASGSVESPFGETNSKEQKPFFRWGLNGSLNYEMLNLSLLFLRGVDKKLVNQLEPTDYEYTGGLAELDWAGLMNNRMVASLMFNWVRPPSYDSRNQVDAYSALLRYYLGDWSAVNVALHAEYTFRRLGKNDPVDDHLLSFIVDFAF